MVEDTSSNPPSIQMQLEAALSLQQATFEATADGLLAVDNAGKIVTLNRRFLEMWRIPDPIIAARDDNQALDFVMSQLKDPEAFLSKVRELYSHPEASSHDLVYLIDGRVFDRYSQPQRLGDRIVGRVWDFRDITEAKHIESEREQLIREHQRLTEFCRTTIGTLIESARRGASSQEMLTMLGIAQTELEHSH